ncbi:hypothetical protein MPSEU_000202500 [Mayamaea pseudoterrestris]|nr:hypothetical protein MPSEU_000202500 [Mayamaea pseudoterrestris]
MMNTNRLPFRREDREMLVKLHEATSFGVQAVPHRVFAGYANYTHLRSTAYIAAVKRLEQADLIEKLTHGIRLTPRAMRVMPKYPPPTDPADALARLQRIVRLACPKAPNSHVFCQVLYDGKIHTRAAVASACNCAHVRSYGFAKVLSVLTSFGFIDNIDGATAIRLKDAAFPLGRI